MLPEEVTAAVRIQSNWLSLMSWRSFAKASSDLDGSIRKLSSGLRINTAADDVAGLAISENFMAQYRGLVQATRNALDGISLVNTAEGALQEIQNMLQRGRELALQAANGILTPENRMSIQTELDNIVKEIDRVSDTTAFNGRVLLSQGNSAAVGRVVYGLRSSWLEQSRKVIKDYYGLDGDGSQLTVRFEKTGPSAAWVTGNPGVNGVLDNLELHVNIDAFAATGAIADDRKIAKALTTATLARSIAFYNLPEWFRSGVADLISGADEQLQADLVAYGTSNVVDAILTPWQDNSIHESAAYLAVKYLDSRLGSGGMKTLMNEMSLSGGAADLDTALLNTLGVDTATFLAEFTDHVSPTGGDAFAGTLLLADDDVGSIRPGDNDSVIPDGDNFTDNPLTPGFDVSWSFTGTFDPLRITLQVGANAPDQIELVIPQVTSLSLGLVGLNVVKQAAKAVDQTTKAINVVSSVRAELGATSNRLDVTVAANRYSSEAQLSNYSRIRDLDFAKQVTEMTKQQIMVQSSGAALAQANSMRQNVMWLLNGLSTPRSGAAFAT